MCRWFATSAAMLFALSRTFTSAFQSTTAGTPFAVIVGCQVCNEIYGPMYVPGQRLVKFRKRQQRGLRLETFVQADWAKGLRCRKQAGIPKNSSRALPVSRDCIIAIIEITEWQNRSSKSATPRPPPKKRQPREAG